jgi:DNA-3-methyladenine glycosylase II
MTDLVFEFAAPLNFDRTLAYIGRYETALRSAVQDGVVFQVLSDEKGYFLVQVSAAGPRTLKARQLTGRSSKSRVALLEKFVYRSFGSDRELRAFYRFAKSDSVLADIVKRFRGVRLVGVVSLWECLGWSILGQQVSIASAFAMRSRLVRRAGAVVEWNGERYEGFPAPADVLKLSGDEMRQCGLSRGKADYVHSLACMFHSGALAEDNIFALSFDEARARLLNLRGIGPWSVEYAMMRSVGDPDACPLADIGLRNAIGKAYAIGRQATMEETINITERWRPFRAYGTFYLWQTLW